MVCSAEISPISYTEYNSVTVNKLLSCYKDNGSSLNIGNYGNPYVIQNSGYLGGVYSPTENNIYFIPMAQGQQLNWHYINCNTGELVEYLHGTTGIVANAYFGGCLSPVQNKIYFIPRFQGAEPKFHFIDCKTSTVGDYDNTLTGLEVIVANSYGGGAYSPKQDRIYMAPRNQGPEDYWHYIDCATNKMVAYLKGNTTVVTLAYSGAVYSPIQNRIYLVPRNQGPEQYWHYIDCDNGNVVQYANNLSGDKTALTDAYAGGVYSPTQNRIYFVPQNQGNPLKLYWHYVDCETGEIVSYLHGQEADVIADAYLGGAYSPVDNRIYFSPQDQSNQTYWHYVDCDTGEIKRYLNETSAVQDAYWGAVYSPTQNRIYLVPLNQGQLPVLHYISLSSNADVSKMLMASAAFNKGI
jgi:hypothetical protein